MVYAGEREVRPPGRTSDVWYQMSFVLFMLVSP